MSREIIGLNSAALVGRMRLEPPSYARREVTPVRPRGISDIYEKQQSHPPKTTTVISSVTDAGASATRRDVHIDRFTKSFAPPTVPKQQTSRVLKRRYAPKPQINKPKFHVSNSKMLMAMAVALFMIGVTTAVIGLRTNKHVEAQVQAVTQQQENQSSASTNNEALPDEKKPSVASTKSYSVAPDLPRYISIPKLGVHARVFQENQKQNGEMNVPGNIYDTGWYSSSSKPGDRTNAAMLIGGHVSGPTKPGVFKQIAKLNPGDTIEVERGDGKVFTYAVVKNEVYDANNVDMGSAMRSVDQSKPGLNLITCTGKVVSNQYTQRVVVYAVQM